MANKHLDLLSNALQKGMDARRPWYVGQSQHHDTIAHLFGLQRSDTDEPRRIQPELLIRQRYVLIECCLEPLAHYRRIRLNHRRHPLFRWLGVLFIRRSSRRWLVLVHALGWWLQLLLRRWRGEASGQWVRVEPTLKKPALFSLK